MTMQSYKAAGPRSLNSEFTNYRQRFFEVDFLDPDFFEPDDLEDCFLLVLVLFCAVDADLVLEADFFADFVLLEPLCLRAFSASMRSPSSSSSSSPNADSAFGKSSFSSSSTWCSTF